MRHPCQSCRGYATCIITGRTPRRTCYSALSCDACLPKHRARAAKAGPIQIEPLEDAEQDPLFRASAAERRRTRTPPAVPPQHQT